MRITRGSSIHIVASLVLAAFLMSGCGKRASHQTSTSKPQQTAGVLLPEWAPKNPSPEFLRAAKVLKPASLKGVFPGDSKEHEMIRTILTRYTRTWPAAWEFFGTLSDEQIQQFVKTDQIRIPVKSLTAKQHSALDNWFDVYREAMAGVGQGLEDFLVVLYKEEAKEDLSNVKVGFTADGHGVNMYFWITRPDGSVSGLTNTVAGI